jgi:hypothetical protein
MRPSVAGEWLNTNAYRSYPFRENSGRTDINGITLPNGVVLDFFLSVPANTVTTVWLSKAIFGVSSIVLAFSAIYRGAELGIGSITVARAGHQFGSAYTIDGIADTAVVKGVLTLGSLDEVYGTFTFDSDATEFEPCLVRPVIPGVSSIWVNNSGTLTGPLSGDVVLEAGENVELTVEQQTIRIDFINQGSTQAQNGSRVLTVNGVPIESVQIVGSDCVEVVTAGNNIVISDTCSTPCCGCPELEELTRRLMDLDTSVVNMRTYASNIDAKIENFTKNLMEITKV